MKIFENKIKKRLVSILSRTNLMCMYYDLYDKVTQFHGNSCEKLQESSIMISDNT